MDESIIATEKAYSAPFVNSTIFPMLLLSLMKQKHAPNTAKTFSREYDYIIVGGGTAGSVVASRLSEIPCVSVLLLEAGKPPPLLTEVPGISRVFAFTDIDWQYKTAPQKYTGNALKNKQVTKPNGKTLGGSSTMNGMLYARGNAKDYDNWESEGAEGWSYKNVLPYFIKLEDNKDPQYVENGYHGIGGPMTVHHPRYQSELKDPLLKTVKKLGYSIVDSNGPRQTGFYDQQANMRFGQRCSTAKAYLVPAENRTNLDILPNAMVRKVLIEKRKAVAVEFDFQSNTHLVRARREVIMSAGTINTAQLLMLSGIGPRKELERFKIPVIADLPVGKNLQDHCASNMIFQLSPNIPPIKEKFVNPVSIEEYIRDRTGILGSSVGVAAMAFLNESITNPKEDLPNHQLYFAELSSEIGLYLDLTPKTYAQIYGPLEGKPFYACVAAVMQPKSRGTVTLQSTDPYDHPVIDPQYYEDPKDMQAVVDGLKNCIRIGTHPEMRRVGSTLAPGLIPSCEKFAGDEENYLWCQVRSIVFTLNHHVGTARMGDPSDPRTVLDPQLRVKGIERLRVVDASVMPIIPSGNTGAPTVMVAEKASDMIKASINCHINTPVEDHCDENIWKNSKADDHDSYFEKHSEL